ncbi:hypothetical protein F7642_11840 [Tenacibaculum finnmarkense genomovar ulcerans]|uniref:hypothetical protein n=2 Tax=Tenacibaculum finnmarkense TaxID=2781243 RepID=UPI00187B9732|nr:hypothetical protein [Tenacibaculum finnmarkense]MBE7635014.1 hypothetical protein [Tenacibaculum finnmarkense genomovar ulcerans]MCG8795940.1 hypothetical protein [Tenacibaculum finnmarkense]MCG8798372.1 hypothetical protein [Tenacibaculum finnmarkense]
MTTTNKQNLMSKKQLLKSVFLAFIVGLLVLLVAILPAEYGVDPLGTGKLMGFAKLYQENKKELVSDASSKLNFKKITLKSIGSDPSIVKPLEANNPPSEQRLTEREDSIRVIVPAKKGVEYKVNTFKYSSFNYEWSSEKKDILYTDFHGEVKQNNPPEEVFYESYTVAYSNNMAGTFTAPFKGKHGWYFKNLTDKDITVVLKLKGHYKVFMK